MLTITHTHTVCTLLFIQPLIKKMSLFAGCCEICCWNTCTQNVKNRYLQDLLQCTSED